MPIYLTRAKMSRASWRRLIDNFEDRRITSRDGESLYGGRFIGYWYSLGDWDVYSLTEAPDDASIASLNAVIAASDGYEAVSCIRLMTVDEMREALAHAATFLSSYHPPGAKAD